MIKHILLQERQTDNEGKLSKLVFRNRRMQMDGFTSWGSVLSTSLFLIVIINIVSSLSPGIRCFLNVDDFGIYISGSFFSIHGLGLDS